MSRRQTYWLIAYASRISGGEVHFGNETHAGSLADWIEANNETSNPEITLLNAIPITRADYEKMAEHV